MTAGWALKAAQLRIFLQPGEEVGLSPPKNSLAGEEEVPSLPSLADYQQELAEW